MTRTKKNQQRTFDLTSVFDGVRDVKATAWVCITGSDLGDLREGDNLLIDHNLNKPKDGDYIVLEKASGKFGVYLYDSDCDYDGLGKIWGIGVAVVRKINRKRRQPGPHNDGDKERNAELKNLREKLTKLERLPENEEIAFQLESEIYRLERQGEWPDVIGGAR